MIVLLDTHTLLWFLRDESQLSAVAKAAIEDPNNRNLVSVASCWEIAIKAGLNKFGLTESSRTLLQRELPRNNFELLSITLEHATAVETLPPYHKDHVRSAARRSGDRGRDSHRQHRRQPRSVRHHPHLVFSHYRPVPTNRRRLGRCLPLA